ncbi:MAG: hypothetical protein H8E40_05035 [Chloroflexi bacterium]|nr:hypothetical protein [Chloroflexota bacterium]
MAVQKKPVTSWKAQDLGLEVSQMRRTRLLQVFQPVRKTSCEFIDGKTPEETGANLALKLREVKIM